MKSLAVLIVFSLVLNVLNIKFEQACESKCLVCQQTVYNLKFYQNDGCAASVCQTNCGKISLQWSMPGSVFDSFKSDIVGKCGVCFRAGYCTMSECQVQKNYETSVINKIVDSYELGGPTGNVQSMDQYKVENILTAKSDANDDEDMNEIANDFNIDSFEDY